jgi:4-amino-4-deoxy-L-arabinose transferase-like glycosyltransferase
VPWRRLHLPIAREHPARQRLVRLALGALAVAVVALWLAFTADYTRARDLYFTIAIVHVLAEVPVVLRLT